MSEFTLTAETGRPTGSSATRRLRREGKIPGVVYGHGTEPLSVAIDAAALRVALNGESGTNQLLELDADGSSLLVLARVLQRHPVRGTVTHIDFQITSRDETVTVEVPLSLIGDAVEVRHADGQVDQQLFAVSVSATPDKIPTVLELDISELVPGQALRVSDLTLPAGVVAETDPESAIVIANVGRAEEVEEVAEAIEGEAIEGDAATEPDES